MPYHIDNKLEKRCSLCEGEYCCREWIDPITNERVGVYCPKCNGFGCIPTEQGDRILDLVRHNLKPLIVEILEELKTTDGS